MVPIQWGHLHHITNTQGIREGKEPKFELFVHIAVATLCIAMKHQQNGHSLTLHCGLILEVMHHA